MIQLLIAAVSWRNPKASAGYVRCSANPLAKAGLYHADEKLFETSIGDPDVHYNNATATWHAFYSTGLAKSYAAPMTAMGIKHAVSTDGVNFTVSTEPVLRTGTDAAAWDHSKAETPTVVRLPSSVATPERQWLMLYSGGNDQAARPPGVAYTWYQLGAAFSSDGETFQKLPANESPYANTSTPFGAGSLEGLVLLGRDVFPGVRGGIAYGLAADPELVVDPDGKTLHCFMSSGATDSSGTFLKYGVSHAVSLDGGVHWSASPGNPVLSGPRGPSVIRAAATATQPPTWQLYFLQDTAADLATIPTTFNPEVGVWTASASSLYGPWTRSRAGAGAGGREVSWSEAAPAESLGWIATGDMAQHAPRGERRWYYVAFDPTPPIIAGWVAPVHTTPEHPLGYAPAMIALSMMHRDLDGGAEASSGGAGT